MGSKIQSRIWRDKGRSGVKFGEEQFGKRVLGGMGREWKSDRIIASFLRRLVRPDCL